MPPDEDRPEPVTAVEAGKALNKAPNTIRWWAKRYNAVQIKRHCRAVYYDMRDLKVIEREIFHGHTVPPTPEEREAIRLRCPLRAAEQSAVSAA